jgi:alkylated DNA repair dioxygenase AlkB
VFTDDKPDTKATPALGWHSDDEADMVSGKPIASISLGDLRRFRVRSKADNEVVWDRKLDHGSLVVMEGRCQELTQHCIWKLSETDVKEGDVRFGLRINLTFRVMRAG